MNGLACISIYFKYFSKMFITTKLIFSNKITISLALPTFVMITLTTEQKAIILLGIFFALDFATGIAASWFEKRRAEKLDPALKEQSLISSEKLKLSMVKAFMYCSSILSIYGIEKVFFVRQFHLDFFEQKASITLLAVAFCCVIELYSVIFENFKRMGFDLKDKVSRIFKTVKSVKDSADELKN